MYALLTLSRWAFLFFFFNFVDGFLSCVEALSLMVSHLFFGFAALLLVSIQTFIPQTSVKEPMLSISFTVSGLTFQSSIHFELILVYGVR